MYRDHYDGHGHYGSYGNGYSEGRRTTRRRLLPATPTGERITLHDTLLTLLRFRSHQSLKQWLTEYNITTDIFTPVVFVSLSTNRSETVVQHPMSEAPGQQ